MLFLYSQYMFNGSIKLNSSWWWYFWLRWYFQWSLCSEDLVLGFLAIVYRTHVLFFLFLQMIKKRKKIREEKKVTHRRESEKGRWKSEKVRKGSERLLKGRAWKAEERSKRAERRRTKSWEIQQNTSQATTRSKVVSWQLREEPAIVNDICCVCNQSFQEDVELEGGVELWIQCSCTRWLHARRLYLIRSAHSVSYSNLDTM